MYYINKRKHKIHFQYKVALQLSLFTTEHFVKTVMDGYDVEV